MRMNKYFASTLIAGLFVSAALTPVMAQEQSLKPKGAWALTKVDRSEEGGKSYCTLSRKYDQDIVLSLGRNQAEEYSLAIDFQKPVFEKDKTLKVNLQPGPGQIRAYDMMPTSDKALVIRLGWDTGFFETLNSSQQMKVKIADKAYSFAMPEVTKGQGELRDCMETLKTAAKADTEQAAPTKDVLAARAGSPEEFDAGRVGGKEPPAATKAAKAEVEAAEKSVLAQFAESIRSQEPKLRGEEAPAKRRNFSSNAEDEKEAAKKEIKVVNAKTPAPKPPVEEAASPELVKRPPPSKPAGDTKVAAAPDEKTLADVAPAAGGQEARKEAKTAKEDVSDKTPRAPDAAAKETASATVADKDVERLIAEKKALEDKLRDLEAKTAGSIKPEQAAKIETRAQELEIKNAQLEENLRNAQVRIGETAINTETKSLRKIADLEVKLEAAKADNAALAKQMESLRVQQEDGRLTAVAGDWDLENATKRYNEAEREVQRLALQLEQQTMNCRSEKEQIESMLFDPAVTERKQIERLNDLQKQVEETSAKIKDQENIIKAQVAEKTKALETEKAALSQQIATLQQSLTQKDQEVAAAKAAAAAIPQQVTAEVAKARAEADAKIASLQQTLTAKDKELADAKAQPKADPAKDAEIASLKQALAAKDQQIAAAAAAPKPPHTDPGILQQIADMQSKIAEMKKDNDTLRDQNILMKTEADRLRLQMADTSSNSGARADQVASMKLEIEDLKRQIGMKDTQNLTYQNQIGVLQKEAAQLKTRLSGSEAQAGSSVDVESLNRQIQSLQKQISNMNGKVAPDRSASAAQYANIQPAAGNASPAAVLSGYDADSIKSLLAKSGVSVASVQKASGLSGADNYSWVDGANVKGLASVKISSGGFDAMVTQYIANLKSQCGNGDFASVPSPTNSGGVKRTALYETACVKGGASTSSSLLFFEDQGRFIAIANQTNAADMDIAMDSRDRIANFVRGL